MVYKYFFTTINTHIISDLFTGQTMVQPYFSGDSHNVTEITVTVPTELQAQIVIASEAIREGLSIGYFKKNW